MIGNRLNQDEMHALGQGSRGCTFQIHIVFGRRKRGIGREMGGNVEINRHRYAQRLRQMRFFGINASEDRHFKIKHLQLEKVIAHRRRD